MAILPIALVVLGVACVGLGLKYVLSETKMRFHLFWIVIGIAFITLGIAVATDIWDTLPAALRLFIAVVFGAFVAYEVVAPKEITSPPPKRTPARIIWSNLESIPPASSSRRARIAPSRT
jgi:hypothetical protein